jgi:hypothetical protein
VRFHAKQVVSVAVIVSAGAFAAGCEREEPVRAYRAPKEVAVTAVAGATGAQSAAAPTWTVPSGWKELPAQEMRFATFAVCPDRPEVVLTVVPLGDAGTLAANVNRWEGQVGKPPTPDDQVEKVVQHLDSNGLHFDVVDVEGPGLRVQAGETPQPKRMLAAMVPGGGRTWFFKLIGPPDVVAAQKGNFDAFIRSVRFGGAAPETGQVASQPQSVSTAAVGPNGPSGAAGSTPGQVASDLPFSWGALPAGWSAVPNVQPPRIAAFKVEGSGQQADLVVTRFPGSAVGSFADNVNRWRGQLGLAPAAEVGSYGPNVVTLGAQKWTIVDVAGDEQPSRPAQRILVGMITVGEGGDDPQTWFFKLQGPSKLVAEQRPALEKFLESVKFQ